MTINTNNNSFNYGQSSQPIADFDLFPHLPPFPRSQADNSSQLFPTNNQMIPSSISPSGNNDQLSLPSNPPAPCSQPIPTSIPTKHNNLLKKTSGTAWSIFNRFIKFFIFETNAVTKENLIKYLWDGAKERYAEKIGNLKRKMQRTVDRINKQAMKTIHKNIITNFSLIEGSTNPPFSFDKTPLTDKEMQKLTPILENYSSNSYSRSALRAVNEKNNPILLKIFNYLQKHQTKTITSKKFTKFILNAKRTTKNIKDHINKSLNKLNKENNLNVSFKYNQSKNEYCLLNIPDDNIDFFSKIKKIFGEKEDATDEQNSNNQNNDDHQTSSSPIMAVALNSAENQNELLAGNFSESPSNLNSQILPTEGFGQQANAIFSNTNPHDNFSNPNPSASPSLSGGVVSNAPQFWGSEYQESGHGNPISSDLLSSPILMVNDDDVVMTPGGTQITPDEIIPPKRQYDSF